MGRNKKKSKKMLKALEMDAIMDEAEDATGRRISIKHLSKKKKRRHQQLENRNKHHVTLSKEHKWYLIKVYDTAVPTKEFLEESFRSMIDTPFTILGYHQSVNSARFFLEDNSAAALAMEALTKRMLGMGGRLMSISVEPSKKFVLMNVEGLQIVQQVLSKRFNNDILDLTSFHYDPSFLASNLLPVLYDDLIFRQILKLIKENAPHVKILNLSKNGLKMQHVRILASSLKECQIERLNLEHNEIENLRELIKSLSAFKLVELKLEGNRCLGDIKDPVIYIRTARSQFPHLKTLDGKDIDSFLAEKSQQNSNSAASTSSPLAETVKTEVAAAVDEAKLQLYLKEYFLCMDSPERLQLVNAFTPTANVKIESTLEGLPSGIYVGVEQIKAALASIPRTKHDTNSFAFKLIKMDGTVGQVEIAGKLLVEGKDRTVDFMQQLEIVPFNSGLGCSISLIKFS